MYGMVNDEAYFHAPLSLLYKATQNVINNVGTVAIKTNRTRLLSVIFLLCCCIVQEMT